MGTKTGARASDERSAERGALEEIRAGTPEPEPTAAAVHRCSGAEALRRKAPRGAERATGSSTGGTTATPTRASALLGKIPIRAGPEIEAPTVGWAKSHTQVANLPVPAVVRQVKRRVWAGLRPRE